MCFKMVRLICKFTVDDREDEQDKVQEVINAKKEAMEKWETSGRQIATGRQTRRQRKQ